MPSASTLNLKSMPGMTVNNVYSIVFPESMTGAMEITIKNFIMAATKDVISLWLDILLNPSTTKTAMNETDRAKRGLTDSITSTSSSFHCPYFINIKRCPVPHQRYQYAKRYSHFSRCYCYNEYGEYLPPQVLIHNCLHKNLVSFSYYHQDYKY